MVAAHNRERCEIDDCFDTIRTILVVELFSERRRRDAEEERAQLGEIGEERAARTVRPRLAAATPRSQSLVRTLSLQQVSHTQHG